MNIQKYKWACYLFFCFHLLFVRGIIRFTGRLCLSLTPPLFKITQHSEGRDHRRGSPGKRMRSGAIITLHSEIIHSVVDVCLCVLLRAHLRSGQATTECGYTDMHVGVCRTFALSLASPQSLKQFPT